MVSKLIKISSFMIAFILVLSQVDQSFALTGYFSPGTVTQADSWIEVHPEHSPPSRFIHGMVYDSGRDVMVTFGGDPDGTGHAYLDDTWEYDGSDWNEVVPDLSPSGRGNIDQAMVYDDARGKTILFGGLSNIGHENDTWEYFLDGDSLTWVPITTTVTPLARDSHALVYDQNRDLTVMFGGYNPGNFYLDDTWEYDGSDWNETSPDPSPPGRHHHAMAHDSLRDVTVLFGGLGESGICFDDTWEYDGSNWNPVTTTHKPPARFGHGMTYDPSRGVTVLFGGYDQNDNPLNDTWEYDGTDWSLANTSQLPTRGEVPLVYNSAREKVVLFGGGYWNGNFNGFNDTWEYPGEVPPIVLAAYADIGMPYDTDRGCTSPYEGCGGPFTGFYAGVGTDLALDAYNSGIPFDIQGALYQDHLNYPGRYRYGTARYAEDMRRYFELNQETISHGVPYYLGDIAFFDWDGDNLTDHVSVISQIDYNGHPIGMVDATGFYSGNFPGTAIEHNWASYFESHIQEHGRVITTTPTLPITPVFTGQALRVRLDASSVALRLWDASGKSVSDTYDEDFVASNVEEFIPYIPGSYYSDLGAQKTITTTSPLSSTPYFIELNALASETYTLYVELIEDSVVVDSETYNKSIETGETHRVSLTLNLSAGKINPNSFALSPSIGTPNSLELTGATNSTAQIVTSISELGGLQPINGAQVSASDLFNQLGETISSGNVTISPSNFDLTAGGIQEITVQVDLSDIPRGMYQGSLLITAGNGYPVSIPLTVIVTNHKVYLPLALNNHQ